MALDATSWLPEVPTETAVGLAAVVTVGPAGIEVTATLIGEEFWISTSNGFEGLAGVQLWPPDAST